MKATGVVRRIDDLGRIVIPKEIRRKLRIKEGDNLEVFVEGEDMNRIQFDFIPISFPVKYSDCKKMNFPDVITLFNKFNTKVLLSKTLFNKVDITFIFDEFNSIDEVNNLLLERYGVPNMIKYGKTYIWKI